jgi:hypothetical protein
MKQVFVAGTTHITPQAAGSNQRFSTLASGEVGIWGNREDSLEGDFFASALLATTMAEADTSGAVAGTALGQAVMLKPEFQLLQGMPAGQNPIASPIIKAPQVQKIQYISHVDAVKGKSVIDMTGKTPAVNEELTFKVSIRFDGDASVYDAQINGEATKMGLGNYPGRVIPYSYTCGSTTLDTEGAAMAADINSNHQLGNFVTASYSSGDDELTLTAKTENTVINVVGLKMISGDFLGDEGVFVNSLAEDTAPVVGAGNYHQVLSEEKQARYSQGNFNRMYFPDAYTSYADSGTVYDQVRITYKNGLSPNVFHGGNAGVNELVFFWKNSAAGDTLWDTVFGFTADTSITHFINS